MAGNVDPKLSDAPLARQSGAPYGDGDRRLTVIRVLTDLFINDHGKMMAKERALHDEVLSGMISEAGVTIRTEVAERLAAIARPPQKVLYMLIRDEIGVARTLLHHSPALGDGDLIAAIHDTDLEHRLAIAERGEISGPVVAALTNSEEPEVLLAVARNLGATIEKEALAHITACARNNQDLATVLVRREPTTSKSWGNLFWTADEGLRRQILKRTNPPTKIEGKLEFAPIRISGFVERREALEGLAALLTTHRQADFQLFLSQMLGISHRLAIRISSDSGGEPFAIACKAANFPGSAFTTLLLLYNPAVSQSVQRVYALSELYETISEPLSWHLLEMWNTQDLSEPAGAELKLRPGIHEPVSARTGATRVISNPETIPQVQIPAALPQKRAEFGRRG